MAFCIVLTRGKTNICTRGTVYHFPVHPYVLIYYFAEKNSYELQCNKVSPNG